VEGPVTVGAFGAVCGGSRAYRTGLLHAWVGINATKGRRETGRAVRQRLIKVRATGNAVAYVCCAGKNCIGHNPRRMVPMWKENCKQKQEGLRRKPGATVAGLGKSQCLCLPF